LEYNSASPKLPGDLIKLGDDQWCKLPLNPPKELRDSSLPDSAYEQKMPSDINDPPLLWSLWKIWKRPFVNLRWWWKK